jgi:hypothetical protein
MSFELSAILLSWLAIGLLAFALAGILRQLRMLQSTVVLLRSPGGTANPLLGLKGAEFVADGLPGAVLFVEPGCEVCDIVRVRLLQVIDRLPFPIRVSLVVADGTAVRADERDKLQVMEGAAVFDRYNVHATPFGLLLDRDGSIVLAEPIGSIDAFDQFVGSSLESLERSST